MFRINNLMTPKFEALVKECLSVIEESSKHQAKELKELVMIAKRLGCTVSETNSGYIVRPPVERMKQLGLPQNTWSYSIHMGERGLHPFRKFMKNVWKYDVPELHG